MEPKIWEGEVIIGAQYAYDKFWYKKHKGKYLLTDIQYYSEGDYTLFKKRLGLFLSSTSNVVSCFIPAFSSNIRLLYISRYESGLPSSGQEDKHNVCCHSQDIYNAFLYAE